MYNGIEFSYAFFDTRGEPNYFKESDLYQLEIHSIVSDRDIDVTKERLVVTIRTPIENIRGAKEVAELPYFYRGDPMFMAEKIKAAKAKLVSIEG